MEISSAKQEDLPRLRELLQQVNELHHRGRPDLFRTGMRKYDDEELSALLSDPGRPVLVAREGGEVLGYAFCVLQYPAQVHPVFTPIKTLYLDDLCVDERFRGRQVGTALFRAVVELARREGCHNVTLNAWAFNASAMGFYEKMGLKPQKTTMEYIL